jgi:hypothetical protein
MPVALELPDLKGNRESQAITERQEKMVYQAPKALNLVPLVLKDLLVDLVMTGLLEKMVPLAQ